MYVAYNVFSLNIDKFLLRYR